MISALYSPALEKAPLLTRLASSRYVSQVLGYLNYDNVLSARATGMLKFLRESGIQLSEFVGNLSEYDTARKIFERQIRYWNCRPMPENPRAVVCPADARGLVGIDGRVIGTVSQAEVFLVPRTAGRRLAMAALVRRRRLCGASGSRRKNITTPIARYRAACSISTRVNGRYHPCNPNAAGAADDASLEESPCGDHHRHGLHERLCGRLGRDDRSGCADDRPDRTALQRISLRKASACREGHVSAERARPRRCSVPAAAPWCCSFSLAAFASPRTCVDNRYRSDVHNRFSLTLGEPLAETDVAVRSLLATPLEEEPC